LREFHTPKGEGLEGRNAGWAGKKTGKDLEIKSEPRKRGEKNPPINSKVYQGPTPGLLKKAKFPLGHGR